MTSCPLTCAAQHLQSQLERTQALDGSAQRAADHLRLHGAGSEAVYALQFELGDWGRLGEGPQAAVQDMWITMWTPQVLRRKRGILRKKQE